MAGLSPHADETEPGLDPEPRRREALVYLGLAAVAAAVCQPVLGSGERWGFWDWDLFESLFEVARKSVVDYAELPGWNPYLRGGEDLVSHPLLPLASPSFLVVLGLGTLPGIKLWIFVRQVVALWSAYWLGRRLALDRVGALAVAVVFGLASCYAQRVAHGHWNLQAFVYLPLCVAFGMDAVRPGRWRSRGLAAGTLALAWLDGGPYAFAYGVIGISVCAGVASVRSRGLAALAAAAAVFALALALAGVKTVPVLSALDETAAPVGYGPGVMLDFYDADFAPTLGEFLYAAWLDRDQASRPGRHPLFLLNVGAYLGPLGLGLALMGLALSRTGRWAWLVAIPLLWICLGQAAPVNLWALLHRLPVIDAMRAPAKFTPCYLLALAVAAGAGADALARRLRDRPVLRSAPVVLVALLAVDLVWVSRPVFVHAFPVEPLAVEAGEFHQREFTPFAGRLHERTHGSLALHPASTRPRHALSANLPAVRANFGVLRTLSGNRRETPAAATPDVGGRLAVVQIADGRDATPELDAWSPNAMRVRVDPSGGTLVVNANYDAGWSARSGKSDRRVAPHTDGKLSVTLEPGDDVVDLSFHSTPARLGVALSAVGLAVLLGCVSRPQSRRPVRQG